MGGLVVWSCTLTQESKGTFLYTFIYFTMQTCSFCAIYFTLAASTSIVLKCECAKVNLKLFKATEFMQSLAVVLSICVVIGFWGFLSKYAEEFGGMVMNVQVHGVSCAITVIDYYICYSQCTFKRTSLLCVGYGILYTIFSVIWAACTHEPIYPVIDWFNDLDLEQETGISAPLVGVICVVILLLACVFFSWFVSWSKSKLIQCYHLPQEQEYLSSDNVDHDDEEQESLNKSNGVQV